MITDLPIFHINVLNEGPEGAVIVTEDIDEHETIEVLNQQMQQNETINSVSCRGTGYKWFHWENVASGNKGKAEKADGLTLHVDPQGRT
jgi:hypothetical protein